MSERTIGCRPGCQISFRRGVAACLMCHAADVAEINAARAASPVSEAERDFRIAAERYCLRRDTAREELAHADMLVMFKRLMEERDPATKPEGDSE